MPTMRREVNARRGCRRKLWVEGCRRSPTQLTPLTLACWLDEGGGWASERRLPFRLRRNLNGSQFFYRDLLKLSATGSR